MIRDLTQLELQGRVYMVPSQVDADRGASTEVLVSANEVKVVNIDMFGKRTLVLDIMGEGIEVIEHDT